MKALNFKMAMLAVAAIVSMPTSAQVTFQQDRDVDTQIGWQAHRAYFNMMDFNGDGLMDGYFGGTSCKNGWQTRGVIVKGLGDGKYEGDFNPVYETYTSQEPVAKRDADGNVITDEGGNPVYETDENGDIIYQEVEHQRMMGMENGTPLSAFAWGYPLDFDQDGLVDMLLQNRGGNDTGTEQRLVLVRNLGDFKFEVVNDETIATTCYGNAGDKYNEGNEYAAVSIADYDKDGYPDIIYQTYGWDQKRGGWSRYVQLLHNKAGQGFECADVFRPLPFDTEVNHKDIYGRTEDRVEVDEDGVEITIPGEWTLEPTYRPKQLSNGCALFVDLNSDGWKDVVIAGWGDGVSGEQGGWQFRYYVNTADGWFTDNTDKLIASIQGGSSLFDVFKAWGHNDLIYYPLDYNQDGAEDILLIGTLDDRNGKQALALLNTSTDGEVSIQEHATNLAATTGVSDSEGTIIFGDFNGDDVVDFYSRGWTDYQEIHNWTVLEVMSNGIDSYDVKNFGWTDTPENGMLITQCGMSVGDLNNDGKLDVVSTHIWTEDTDDFIPSFNTTDFTPTSPDAPENVAAHIDENGNVEVTWDPVTLPSSGGQAMYNVYAIDKATGFHRMLVPANVETGKQSGYAKYGAYALGGLDGEPRFTFCNLPEGQYTIGVQSVSYSYLASPFATTVIDVAGDGLKSVAAQKMTVTPNGNTITVNAASSAAVQVYGADGRLVARGTVGSPITVNGHGVFVVKAGKASCKIAK